MSFSLFDQVTHQKINETIKLFKWREIQHSPTEIGNQFHNVCSNDTKVRWRRTIHLDGRYLISYCARVSPSTTYWPSEMHHHATRARKHMPRTPINKFTFSYSKISFSNRLVLLKVQNIHKSKTKQSTLHTKSQKGCTWKPGRKKPNSKKYISQQNISIFFLFFTKFFSYFFGIFQNVKSFVVEPHELTIYFVRRTFSYWFFLCNPLGWKWKPQRYDTNRT